MYVLIGNRQLCTAPSKEYLSILIKWSINMSDIIVIHPFRGHRALGAIPRPRSGGPPGARSGGRRSPKGPGCSLEVRV